MIKVTDIKGNYLGEQEYKNGSNIFFYRNKSKIKKSCEECHKYLLPNQLIAIDKSNEMIFKKTHYYHIACLYKMLKKNNVELTELGITVKEHLLKKYKTELILENI